MLLPFFRSLSFILVATCILAPDARGQRLTEFAPLEWHLAGGHARDAATTTVIAGVGRAVPVFTILPQTTVDSHIRLLDVGLGVRFSDTDADFRYRGVALDMDIQRTPQSASVTLLDVDRSGLRDSHITWARLGYGPALSRTSWRRQFTLKTRIETGLVSSKWGSVQFSDIPGHGMTHNGIEARALGVTSITVTPGLDVAVVAWHAVHSFKGDLRWSEVTPTLTWYAHPTLRLDISVQWVRATGNDATVTDVAGGVRFRYTPQAVRF
ncbi:MAG: hypothetical protein RIE53_06780 [Rhodothermales bacterium]